MRRTLPLTVVTLSLSVQPCYLSGPFGRDVDALTRKKRCALPESSADNNSCLTVSNRPTNNRPTNRCVSLVSRRRFLVFVLVLLALFSVIYSKSAMGQEGSGSALIEEMIEQLLDEADAEIDVDEWKETLRYYRERPIDLNKTDERELAKLYLLSPLQIASLLAHRVQSGAFLSVLELQGIAHFDLATITRLSPFVTVSPPSSLQGISGRALLKESNQQLMIRYGRVFESQRGYQITDTSRSRYLGDANRYMLRYRLNFKDKVRLAINMEKDAGEPFFSEQQRYGFDHYGISLSVNDVGRMKELVLGDFALQVGQGLVMWNGLSFGKGAMVTSSARQGIGLRSYTSLSESNYLTGAATRLSFANWEFTPFVSWRKLSGNRELMDNGNYLISAISTSGLHRTPNELNKRRAVGQGVAGMDVSYRYKRLKLGVIGVFTYYNGAVVHDGSPRNAYAFQGDRLANLGLNYQYTFRNVYLFGETAYQYGSGWATLNGLVAGLHPKLSVFANYRNFQKDYYAAFAQALGEGSTTANEEGLYAGLAFHPSRKIEWLSYIDIFRFPWLRYRVDAPSKGMDILTQFSYIWYKLGRISLRYRHRLRQQNNQAEPAERKVVDVWKDQLRLAFRYKLSDRWEIQTRLEGVRYEKDGTVDLGWMTYQDLFWRPIRLPIQLNMRVALFSTDSYDARLYAYENDVLYASAFPMYNGRGGRTYLNLRYRMSRKADFWLRYSRNQYLETATVGSGLDESQGPKRSDIKLQFRYRW